MTQQRGTSLLRAIAHIATGAAACLLVVVLSGCFTPTPDIVGSWSAPGKDNDRITYTYTFNDDGTALVEVSNTSSGEVTYREETTWMADFGNVVMDFAEGEDVVFTVSLTGGSISDSYGNTYHRDN